MLERVHLVVLLLDVNSEKLEGRLPRISQATRV